MRVARFRYIFESPFLNSRSARVTPGRSRTEMTEFGPIVHSPPVYDERAVMRTRLRYGLAWIDIVLHFPPGQEEEHSVAIITRAMKTHSDGRNIPGNGHFSTHPIIRSYHPINAKYWTRQRSKITLSTICTRMDRHPRAVTDCLS